MNVVRTRRSRLSATGTTRDTAAIDRFYIDLSCLGSATTGVGVYALKLSQYLEERFHCAVLAPPQFQGSLASAVSVPAPWQYRNAVIARAPLGRASSRAIFGKRSFVYAPHMRPYFLARNQTLTIHDLIHHEYPTRNLVENSFNSVILPRVLRRGTPLLTVSHTSKHDLCQLYELPDDQVRVVPNGIDVDAWRPSGRPPASDPPYLLVVGANRIYKNTLEVLKHHALWADRYRLVVVGTRSRYGGVVREAVRTLGLERVVDLRDSLSEHDLIRLYQDCTATVYPSLIEGFGRPALEAMAVGRPVILSDIPVHQENFAPAALFVSPADSASWARAIGLLANQRMVAEASRQGMQIARELTWERSGSALVEALLEIEPRLDALWR